MGFHTEDVKAGDAVIHVRVGGKGPPDSRFFLPRSDSPSSPVAWRERLRSRSEALQRAPWVSGDHSLVTNMVTNIASVTRSIHPCRVCRATHVAATTSGLGPSFTRQVEEGIPALRKAMLRRAAAQAK